MGSVNAENIKRHAELVLNEITVVKTQINALKSMKTIEDVSANMTSIADIVVNIVMVIETVSTDLTKGIEELKSEDKCEAAAEILDDIFKFNWYIELVDKQIFKLLISTFVYFLNDKFGKDWDLSNIRKIIKDSTAVLNMITSKTK